MIIGITGTLGAGKGTVVDHLVKTRGFAHYSVRKFLTEELERRGLPINRDSMNTLGEGLRAEHGASYIVDELCRRAGEAGGDAVVESIRTVGEAESIKRRGALLWGVDADPKARYERAILRGSETDKVSFEKFMADEQRESQGDDPARMNISKCMALADVIFSNDGSREELFAQVEKALEKES